MIDRVKMAQDLIEKSLLTDVEIAELVGANMMSVYRWRHGQIKNIRISHFRLLLHHLKDAPEWRK